MATSLPAADTVIHSGDVSFAGRGEEVMDFIEWFGELKYKYKIFIAGNHDSCLDGKAPARIQRFLPANMYYLCDSGVEIEGIYFWGIPYMMSYELQSERQQRSLEAIPSGAGVLITHRPPLDILDRSANISFGCHELLDAVRRICLCYHLFGHIHGVYGLQQSGTTFVNASILDEKYFPTNKPVNLEI